MEREVFIHVGMPKTGSTFLQQVVFRQFEAIDYWEVFNHPSSYYIERIANSNYLNFNPDWGNRLNELVEKSPSAKILISFEGLFGSYSNNYKSNFTNALILKKIFPQAKIIMCIRKQEEILKSNYAQLVSEGYSASFKQYINYNSRTKEFDFERIESRISINLSSLNYGAYIEHYRTLFGASSVHVVPFEQMRKDISEFTRSVTDFIGVEPLPLEAIKQPAKKKALPRSGMVIARLLNRVFVPKYGGSGIIPRSPYYNALVRRGNTSILFSALAKLSKLMSPQSLALWTHLLDKRSAVKPNAALAKAIHSRYKNDNKRTDELLTNLDLKGLGYY
ncbi:MAG: sulfotransferase [Flavobacteriales bacterium]|nr:sulfotransferase [Flavobacteriales bacterium]